MLPCAALSWPGSTRPRRRFQGACLANIVLSSERELGALAYRLWNVERANDQLLHALAWQRIELDIELLDVGDEIRILDHGVESVAQDFHALGRDPGWCDHSASDRASAGVEGIDLLVLCACPDLGQSRCVRQVLGAFRGGLQNDANLLVA